MLNYKFISKLSVSTLAVSLFLTLLAPVYAAAPDGMGPWADSVVKFSQGLEKNGSPVLPIRSDPTAALGVAEGTNADGVFTSLGFGGQLTLKFVNGISGGVFVVESTRLPYPIETAKVEVSGNGKKWTTAGNLNRSGSVNQPANIKCAHYIRITDTSNPALFEPTADGYDVDGVKAQGANCTKEDEKDNEKDSNDKCTDNHSGDTNKNDDKNSCHDSSDNNSSDCKNNDNNSH